MNLHWRLFTNCTSEADALKVARKHFENASVAVSGLSALVYHKGGFQVSGVSDHPQQPWADFVLFALALAQNTGNSWLLSGSIAEELDAWSNVASVPGISSIHVQALRQV